MTPATTFGNWFSPFSRRQVFDAAMTSLNTISLAVVAESAPLVRTVRCRTVANDQPPRGGPSSKLVQGRPLLYG